MEILLICALMIIIVESLAMIHQQRELVRCVKKLHATQLEAGVFRGLWEKEHEPIPFELVEWKKDDSTPVT